MPSNFANLWNASHKTALNPQMGEPVTVQFVLRGEFTGVSPDPQNPPYQATAILVIEDILAMSASVLAGTAQRSDVIISDPSATFEPGQFGPGRPVPKSGTRLIRTSWADGCQGAPVYEVLSILQDSVGQWIARLAAVNAEVID